MKTVIYTPDAPAEVGPYSQAIALQNILFCAGQIPIDPKTNQIVPGGITEQTTQVCKNIAALLKAHKMTFANVVKSTVFLVNTSDFEAMNAVYALYFERPFPARTTIQISSIPLGGEVEIEVIAAQDREPDDHRRTRVHADFL
jgi:2-iminobutanoate/2-iminopropanoate deaminase